MYSKKEYDKLYRAANIEKIRIQERERKARYRAADPKRYENVNVSTASKPTRHGEPSIANAIWSLTGSIKLATGKPIRLSLLLIGRRIVRKSVPWIAVCHSPLARLNAS